MARRLQETLAHARSGEKIVAEPANGEWVVLLPEPRLLSSITQVKGMLLIASRQQLRAAGRFERYESLQWV